MSSWLLLSLLWVSLAYCSDKTEYQTGALVDLQMVDAASGYSRAGQTFCLAVTVGDLRYLLHYGPIWAYGYAPSDFIVGDSVQVRTKGNTMYLKKPKGGELKTAIIRRERSVPDKLPVGCGETVTVRH
jgi:hypothetical protein